MQETNETITRGASGNQVSAAESKERTLEEQRAKRRMKRSLEEQAATRCKESTMWKESAQEEQHGGHGDA